MIGAGDLRYPVTIQRFTVTGQTPLNEDIEDWADLLNVRARREDAGSGEKESAGQVGAFLMARFAIRRSAIADGVKPTDRLVHDGATWNIKEVKRLREAPLLFIEITAVRDADP